MELGLSSKALHRQFDSESTVKLHDTRQIQNSFRDTEEQLDSIGIQWRKKPDESAKVGTNG